MRRMRFPPSPAHPGSAGPGWGRDGTRSGLVIPPAPAAPWGLAACSPLCLAFLPFVSGSISLFAWFFLFFFFFCCLHPSFLHWPSLSLSFFMRAPTPSQGFPSFPPSPFFLHISTILFPFPPSAALSCSFPLPSQLQLELIRYLSSSAKLLVASHSSPGGGEQSWTIRLFHAAPSLMNTINNAGRWAHLRRRWDGAGRGAASSPGCPTAGPGTWDAAGDGARPPSSCPCSRPGSEHPVEEPGGWFWRGDAASPGGTEAPRLLPRISPLAPQPGAPLLLLDL